MTEKTTDFLNYQKRLLAIARKYGASYSVPIEDVFGHLSEEFVKMIGNYDEGRSKNKDSYVQVIMTQRAIKYVKRECRRYYGMINYFAEEDIDKDESVGGIKLSDIADDYDIESDAIYRIEGKKDEDKRQLIHDLMKDADELTKAIVSILSANPNVSYSKIGRTLGIHHETVRRRLAQLANNYDVNKYGDVSEYLMTS